jgi:methyl-accepting chemotaxis protein
MFDNVTIRTRLVAGFAIVLALLVALTAISIGRVSDINDNLSIVNDVNSVKQRYAINFRGSVHDRAIALRDIVLIRSPQEREQTLSNIRTLAAKYAASAGPLDAMLAPDRKPDSEEVRILASIKSTEARTMPLIDAVIARRAAGDDDGAWNILMNQARPQFVEWLARINQLIDLEEAKNKAIATATREATEGFGVMLMLLCGGAMILGGLVAWWSISSTRPIRAMAAMMERLEDSDGPVPCAGAGNELGQLADAMASFRTKLRTATADGRRAEEAKEAQITLIMDSIGEGLIALSKGDLTAEVTAQLDGPYGQLKSHFNQALTNLRRLIGAVTTSATAIRTGSSEIAQASEDLARRTEANAASLQETASSVQQMDSRLRASAAAATRTVERADQAIATVGGGRAVANEAVQAMGRVSDSAKGIDSVIEGLDKIAFQTRVLAMNAAVEAGRAGDAGRGFAVVADLVSALAMRAEEEAKRARDQLTVTQTDIVTAVEAVTKVDGALANISGDVAQVHELLATMAVDNQAQASAITEITAAINMMDVSTQQNAAMVEETSAAAHNLTGEVKELVGQAQQFVFDTSHRPETRARSMALEVA